MYFIDATLQQLAVAIVQGRFDANNVQFINRPRFTFLPSHIDLDDFNVGVRPNGMIHSPITHRSGDFNVGIRPQWYDLPQ